MFLYGDSGCGEGWCCVRLLSRKAAICFVVLLWVELLDLRLFGYCCQKGLSRANEILNGFHRAARGVSEIIELVPI